MITWTDYGAVVSDGRKSVPKSHPAFGVIQQAVSRGDAEIVQPPAATPEPTAKEVLEGLIEVVTAGKSDAELPEAVRRARKR